MFCELFEDLAEQIKAEMSAAAAERAAAGVRSPTATSEDGDGSTRRCGTQEMGYQVVTLFCLVDGKCILFKREQ